MRDDIENRRAAFAELHQAGCFVIPNPWDVGIARFLRHLGFRALATTSAGFQFSRGKADAPWNLPRDVALAHVAEIVAATDLPVHADFQSGYAHEPEGVAANVALCVDTGVAGLSIEDATGDDDEPLYELSLAVERVEAARAALDAKGGTVLLTAGSALARAAWGAFIRAATAIAERGSFEGLAGATPFAELNGVFGNGPTPLSEDLL